MNATSVVCTTYTYTYVCMYSCECVLRTHIALYTKSVIRPWIRHALHCILPLCCGLCMQNVWCGLPPMEMGIR